MGIIFDGKKLALEKEKILAKKVAEFKKKTGITPKLISFMMGDDPASELYLRLKGKAAKRVGIEFEKISLPAKIGLNELIALVKEKNQDRKVHGIMIQMPLPEKFAIRNSQFAILNTIVPEKDADCLTPENFGLLTMGKPRFLPATVKAVVEIIQSSKFKTQGSNIVVVGASDIVGKPLAMVLSNMGGTVTVCRSKTKNLSQFTRRADILISATGVPGLIKKEMVKKKGVVIDVGSPVGDVDFEEVKKVAGFITPVPGGVGPLTVVCLLENVFKAASG